MKYRNLSNVTLDTTFRQNSFLINKHHFDSIRHYNQSNINTTQINYFDNSIESAFYSKNYKNIMNEDVSEIINSSMLFNDQNFQINQKKNNKIDEKNTQKYQSEAWINQKQIDQNVNRNIIEKSNIENTIKQPNTQNIVERKVIDKQTAYKWFEDYKKKQRKKKLLKNYLLPKMNHHQKNNIIQSSQLKNFKKTLKPIKNKKKKQQKNIENIENQQQQNKQNLIKNIKIQISLQQCRKTFKQRCKIQLQSLQIKPFNEIKKQKCFFNLDSEQLKQLIENKTQVQSFRKQTDRCKFIPLKLQQSSKNIIKRVETSIPEFLMTQVNYKNKSDTKRKFLEFKQHRSEIFMEPIKLFKTANKNKSKYMSIA